MYLAVVRVNILVQIVKGMVFVLNAMEVGVLVKHAKVMEKSDALIVMGQEILLMRNAMNVGAVDITDGIRNVGSAMEQAVSSGDVKTAKGKVLLNVIIAMAMEAGTVMNVTGQERVRIVREKDTFNVKHVGVLENVENARARGEYGAPIAMVKEFALIVKEKNSLLVPVAMEQENFRHTKSIHSLRMRQVRNSVLCKLTE